MIDPVHSLAFSIQANPGVYAILLGSGVSRAAKIPTGWDITLDLIRKIAALSKETCEPDPEKWYRCRFGRAPEYSDLLDAIAKTPAERQQLLRSYWEPDEDEREDGWKQPTAAHRSIAALAAGGFIRVIVTTNFDRLMEAALNDAGVVPTVLSSPDQVEGALPIVHTRCCLFKVHGDYLDPRIRNTPVELASYPDVYDTLLDRIFDEFGLVVCGWSAGWDEALRSAILRARSRRFATYWALYGKESDEARRLIEHRDAQRIRIESADAFFLEVHRHVESIEEYSRPHPLSVEAAVSSLKRYVSERRYRVQLSDLVDATVVRIIEGTSGEDYAVSGASALTTESATARIRGYESSCSTLLALGPIGGYWAEEDHFLVWRQALSRLTPARRNGLVFWLGIQRYPATLLLYALGLGALAADKLDFLGYLFATPIHRDHGEDVSAVEYLPPFGMYDAIGQKARILEGMDQKHAPLNEWMHGVLRESAMSVVPEDDQYTLLFDKLEILISLSAARHHGVRHPGEFPYFVPGAYGYRAENGKSVLREIRNSLSSEGANSPFVTVSIIGDTVEDCIQRLDALEEWIPTLRWNTWDWR